jgi:hypothetical protein
MTLDDPCDEWPVIRIGPHWVLGRMKVKHAKGGTSGEFRDRRYRHIFASVHLELTFRFDELTVEQISAWNEGAWRDTYHEP